MMVCKHCHETFFKRHECGHVHVIVCKDCWEKGMR